MNGVVDGFDDKFRCIIMFLGVSVIFVFIFEGEVEIEVRG